MGVTCAFLFVFLHHTVSAFTPVGHRRGSKAAAGLTGRDTSTPTILKGLLIVVYDNRSQTDALLF